MILNRVVDTVRSMVGLGLLLPASLALGALMTPNRASAAPQIEFELITEPGFPLGGAQQWVAFLAKLNQTSIRIRHGEAGERDSVENRGTAEQPLYHVLGILTAGNRLRLPGGEFGLNDRTRLGDWIKKLQTDGITGPTKKTTVFGLTEEQLVAFHDKLTAPIGGETRGRRAGDVAREIVKGLAVEVSVSDSARQAFSAGERLQDDLQPLSGGTALAAAIRPLGLVFRPEKTTSGTVRMLICDVRETEESWPIGWPPQQIPAQVAPKLFEYLKVTITSRPLTEATDAIQQRVQIPFLFDRNSLARRRIDPEKIKVSYTKDRAMYQKILDNLLFQADLTSELRLDEAGHAFLWISPR